MRTRQVPFTAPRSKNSEYANREKLREPIKERTESGEAGGNDVLSILRRSEFLVVPCGTNLPDMEGKIGFKPASCNR
jgi:hypothetical protein